MGLTPLVGGGMKRGEREKRMEKSALMVIDLQNDITKNYRDIIDGVNEAIRRAEARGMEIVYIRHNNLSAGTRAFKPGRSWCRSCGWRRSTASSRARAAR